ncbi:MAG TPA: futalosine hydrolase [Hanamia sp.]
MNLLVVAATKFEIAPFLKENPNADVLITGVGIPATIFHLTKKLSENKYDLAIQAGIAGAFGNRLNLGDVVAVEKDTFGDLGIDEDGNFQTLFEKEFVGKNDFPFHDGWLINHTSSFNNQGLPQAKGITVNLVTGDSTRNKWTEEKFSADIESMEGAAFHYVCLQQEIDFLQLRSISNKVGERDKTKWETAKAIKNLNEELFKTINNLSI